MNPNKITPQYDGNTSSAHEHIISSDTIVPPPTQRPFEVENENTGAVRQGTAIGDVYKVDGHDTVLVDWNLPAGGVFTQRLGKVGMFTARFNPDNQS